MRLGGVLRCCVVASGTALWGVPLPAAAGGEEGAEAEDCGGAGCGEERDGEELWAAEVEDVGVEAGVAVDETVGGEVPVEAVGHTGEEHAGVGAAEGSRAVEDIVDDAHVGVASEGGAEGGEGWAAELLEDDRAAGGAAACRASGEDHVDGAADGVGGVDGGGELHAAVDADAGVVEVVEGAVLIAEFVDVDGDVGEEAGGVGVGPVARAAVEVGADAVVLIAE